MKRNSLLIAWLVLLALSALGVVLAYGKIGHFRLVVFLFGISYVKFMTIALEYMELKHAHPFWKIVMGVLGLLYGVMAVVLLA